jgi:hypothetical protein
MINKRKNVFETNSSSVHTITLNGNNINDLKVDKDGYVHLELGYYGKDYEEYNNSYDKLCYAILTVCYTRGIFLPYLYSEEPTEEDIEDWKSCLEDLMDTYEYKQIEECVCVELNRQNRVCYGIKIHMTDCGIDHQSSHEYDSLDEFLEKNNMETIHDFIFGGAVLTTDCD